MVTILNGGIVKISDARIMMRTRNFSGEERKFNLKGNRNFCVFIDDAEIAQQLANDGWNIRVLTPREEGDETSYYVQVAVGFKVAAPKIVMISGENHSTLTENNVGTLDFADIEKVDMAIRPRYWEDERNGGAKRVKAYLKTLYVTLKQDEFQDDYGFDDIVDDNAFGEEEVPFA